MSRDLALECLFDEKKTVINTHIKKKKDQSFTRKEFEEKSNISPSSPSLTLFRFSLC